MRGRPKNSHCFDKEVTRSEAICCTSPCDHVKAKLVSSGNGELEERAEKGPATAGSQIRSRQCVHWGRCQRFLSLIQIVATYFDMLLKKYFVFLLVLKSAL